MIGLKIMRLHDDGIDRCLASPMQNTLWPAVSLIADGRPMPAAAGIHAYADWAPLWEDACKQTWRGHGWPPEWAVAQLEAEGEVVIGTRGWVAEAATITRIWVPRERYLEWWSPLERRYRVPVAPLRLPRDTRWADVLIRHAPDGRQWLRQHYGPEYVRHYLPPRDWAIYQGLLRAPASLEAFSRVPQGPLVAMVRYDPQCAAATTALHRAYEELSRVSLERKAADAVRRAAVLRAYIQSRGPIPCVRVSSACARRYRYWCAVRYEVRLRADGVPTYRACERARSARRSIAAAESDAIELAAGEGRVRLQARPGWLDGAALKMLVQALGLE